MTIHTNAQIHDLQNANWYFGNRADVSFTSDILNPQSTGNNQDDSPESTASVSDSSGNILFFSDGENLKNSSHLITVNGSGLLGSQNSGQGPIFVPRPLHDSYYLITINGNTASRLGLYYSEISLNLEDIISGVKNIPLMDHNGIAIDSLYGSKSEKITSTRHCNLEDYWIVTQIGQYVYSYHVSSSGINPIPESYTLSPCNADNDTPANNFPIGQMKISPDGRRLGICYSGVASGSTPFNGGIALASFNSSTGEVIFDSNAPIREDSTMGHLGLEFSLSGEYCYFTTYPELSRVKTANNPSSSDIEYLGTYNGLATDLQIGINGKIYMPALFPVNLPVGNKLHVINSPDDPIDPDVQQLSVDLDNPSNALVRQNLPQWVPWQGINCLTDLTLDNPEITSTHVIYAYSESITLNTNYVINAGQYITMKAGEYIMIMPNTHISKDALFSAVIEECGACNNSLLRYENNEYKKNKELFTDEIDKVILNPNPAHDRVTIISSESMYSISITSHDGKTLYTSKGNDKKEITISVQNYISGIYFVNVVTTKGSTVVKRLIIK